MVKDINDRLMAGELPADPADSAVVISAAVPRVKSVVEMLQGSKRRLLDKTKRRGCTTGHYELDLVTGGYVPGFTWVFGAESSWGKSSDLIMVADENIKLKKKVLIVSAEDDETLYADRLMIRRARVNADRFKAKNLTREEYAAIEDVAAKGEDVPCFLDARGKSIEWTIARTVELFEEYDIDLAAFDYLQRFDSDKRTVDRRLQINHIFNLISDTCKLRKVPAIVYSQITPNASDPYPTMYSIRESKDVTNAAEVVALGFTPKQDLARGDRILAIEGKKSIYLDKSKNGQPDLFFEMDWDNNCACFNTVLRPDQKLHREVTGGEFDEYGDNV